MTKYIDVEPLKAKIKELAEEITRLLAENEKLKKDLEYYHTGTDICDIESAKITGQNEDWELARKIILNNGYSVHDLYEIFGYADSQTLMKNHTYPEAAAKVEEWKKAKEKIASNLLALGVPIETIMQASGLSEEEIKNIQ